GREVYPGDTQNFAPAIASIQGGSPELLVGGTGGADDAIQIVRAAKIAGLAPQAMYFTIAVVEPDFVASLGEDAEYILGTTEWEPSLTELPGFDRFVQDYEAEHDEEPVEDVATAYGLAQVLQAAVEEAGELDDAKINTALRNLEMTTVFGTVKADPETGMQTGKEIYVIQIQDGKREIVWPDSDKTS